MILRTAALAIGASVLLLSTTLAVNPSDISSDIPVSQLLTLAFTALSSGSSQDALIYYDIAISREPQNYLTFFKRGATYLSLGRSLQAQSDFDRVLAIKPGFEGALVQRAKIRARSANWQGAREDYLAAGKRRDGEEFRQLDEAEGAAALAKDAEKNGDWEACVSQAGAAIVVAGAALELRQRRVRCRLEKGEVMEALGDLQHVQQINPSAAQPPMQISAMTFYSLGETQKGLEAIRKCLHSDPDSKTCSQLLKKEKKVDKELKTVKQFMEKRMFSQAIKLLVPGSEDEPGLIQVVKDDIKAYSQQGIIHPKAPQSLLSSLLEMTCDSYINMNNHKRATPYCAETLTHNPTSLPALLHRAQAQLDTDDFDSAIRTLSEAKDHHPSDRTLNDLLQKAHTLLKRSKAKDYYKVLSVPRDASPKDIKRAFLKLSKIHHPDKARSAEEKPAFEKKMASINEAYEVLSDPELKQRFDNGDDPNDPEGRSAANPFQGGSPFGGGGQQFVFRQGGGGGGGGGGMPNFGGFGGGGAQFKFPGGFPFP